MSVPPVMDAAPELRTSTPPNWVLRLIVAVVGLIDMIVVMGLIYAFFIAAPRQPNVALHNATSGSVSIQTDTGTPILCAPSLACSVAAGRSLRRIQLTNPGLGSLSLDVMLDSHNGVVADLTFTAEPAVAPQAR